MKWKKFDGKSLVFWNWFRDWLPFSRPPLGEILSMKIALDYDKTFTLDKDFWYEFYDLAKTYGHDVRIVTARSPNLDPLSVDRRYGIPVIYCDGVAKRFVCQFFADNYKGWEPDVWIDDKPENVGNNSTATKEILEKWRESDEYKD